MLNSLLRQIAALGLEWLVHLRRTHKAVLIVLIEWHVFGLCELICSRTLFVWRFWSNGVQVRLRNVISKPHLTLDLQKSWLEMVLDRVRELSERSWVRHAKLVSFMDGLFNCIVVAKSLPLCIDWVNTSTWEEALFDESLPVNLVLILFAWVLLSDLEYLDQLSNCKPCPLPRELFHLLELSHLSFSPWVLHVDGILNFQNDVLIHGKSLLLNMHVNQPLIRHNISRIIFFDWNLRSLLLYDFLNLVLLSHFELLFDFQFWVFKNLNREAFNQARYLSTVVVDKFNIIFAHIGHVEHVRDKTKHWDVFTK